MADIDRTKFALAVAAKLLALGREDGRDGPLPLVDAQRRFDGVSAGSLSRIANGIEVSAPVMLAVCQALGLDPFAFLDLDIRHPHSKFGKPHRERKQLSNQDVSVPVPRETSQEARSGVTGKSQEARSGKAATGT